MIETAVSDFLGALGPRRRLELLFPSDSATQRDRHSLPKPRNGRDFGADLIGAHYPHRRPAA